MNHFELRGGGGGTDFRPAFEYVNQLCAEKKFSNLRGLLYFTDGMGTYPAKRPAYDTAFSVSGGAVRRCQCAAVGHEGGSG